MEKLIAIFTAIIISIMIMIALLQPYFKMQSSNKFSSKKVNYFDALFLDLRINDK